MRNKKEVSQRSKKYFKKEEIAWISRAGAELKQKRGRPIYWEAALDCEVVLTSEKKVAKHWEKRRKLKPIIDTTFIKAQAKKVADSEFKTCLFREKDKCLLVIGQLRKKFSLAYCKYTPRGCPVIQAWRHTSAANPYFNIGLRNFFQRIALIIWIFKTYRPEIHQWVSEQRVSVFYFIFMYYKFHKVYANIHKRGERYVRQMGRWEAEDS